MYVNYLEMQIPANPRRINYGHQPSNWTQISIALPSDMVFNVQLKVMHYCTTHDQHTTYCITLQEAVVDLARECALYCIYSAGSLQDDRFPNTN